MNDNLKHLEQRARRYWYMDGLAELTLGGICLVLGAYFLLQALLPEESLAAQILSAGMALLIIGLVFLGRKIVGFFKERLTYPRTGYVSYKQPPGQKRWIAAGAALIAAAVIVLFTAMAPPVIAWVPLVSGALIGAALAYFSYKVKLRRVLVLAGLSLLFGLGMGFSGLEDNLGLAIYYGLMGLALLTSGGLTLARYLSQTQPPEEARDG